MHAASSAESNDPIDILRSNIREVIVTEQKQQRDKTFNSNRKALGELTKEPSFTAEYVKEKALALKHKKLEVKEYHQLQNALIQGDENINSFLSISNITCAVARDLSGKNPVFQLCAASCSCNIALGNSKACTTLGKSIAPYLISQLDSLNHPLLDICIWTIGNLVIGSNKAFEIFHAQGCFRYLTMLMQNCDNSILSSVTYTLTRYIYAGSCYIPENHMVELLQAVMKREFQHEDPNFMWLLALLSSTNICAAMFQNVLPLVVEYLYFGADSAFSEITKVTASIRILANTVPESAEQANVLLNNPRHSRSDLGTLFNKLLSHQHSHIRKETLWLAGNLYNHTSPDICQSTKDVLCFVSSLKHIVPSVP